MRSLASYEPTGHSRDWSKHSPTAGEKPKTASDASLTPSRSPRFLGVSDIGTFAFHYTVCYTF